MTEIDSQFLLLINGLHTGYLDQLMWLISGKLVWIPFYIITLFAIYQKRGWQGALHLLLFYGFPSAHAANYWGLSLLVAYFMKSKRVLYSLFSLSLIVCYSRSYLGVHYPGDLLGGILYSTFVVGIIIWIYQKYLPKRFVPEVRECSSKNEWIPATTVLATLAVFAVIAAF